MSDRYVDMIINVTVVALVETFKERGRTLLRDAVLNEERRAKINTTLGAIISNGKVTEALNERELRRKDAAATKAPAERERTTRNQRRRSAVLCSVRQSVLFCARA